VLITKIPAHSDAARKGRTIAKIVNDNKQIAANATKGSTKSAVLFLIALKAQQSKVCLG
jgi:hypothetical protein